MATYCINVKTEANIIVTADSQEEADAIARQYKSMMEYTFEDLQINGKHFTALTVDTKASR